MNRRYTVTIQFETADDDKAIHAFLLMLETFCNDPSLHHTFSKVEDQTGRVVDSEVGPKL